MYATEQPTLHTNKDGIKGDLRGTVEIRIRLPTGKVITLLELDVVMLFICNIYIYIYIYIYTHTHKPEESYFGPRPR